MTAAVRTKRNHPDAVFAPLDITAGRFSLTFDQNARVIGQEIGAIHTSEEGKKTRFIVRICDTARRQEFADGIGRKIQQKFEARCNEVFARRSAGGPGDLSTPDRHLPAWEIAAMGAWDKSGPTLVFVLAQWSWRDDTGLVQTSGREPEIMVPEQLDEALDASGI